MGTLEIVLAAATILSAGFGVYQTAVLNQTKKRKRELQFLLAGIHQLAQAKQLGWNNQMNLLPRPQNDRDLAVFRAYTRARDNLMEITSAISALEGVIEPDRSAIAAMLEKSIKQAELNNSLQEVGLRNPTLPQNRKGPRQGTALPETQGDEAEGNSDVEDSGDARHSDENAQYRA